MFIYMVPRNAAFKKKLNVVKLCVKLSYVLKPVGKCAAYMALQNKLRRDAPVDISYKLLTDILLGGLVKTHDVKVLL